MDNVFFTLYCFHEVFDISYTGASNELLSLFNNAGCSHQGLYKVAAGITKPDSYRDLIVTDSPDARKVIDGLSVELINWLYSELPIDKKPPADSLDKYQKINEILRFSLSHNVAVQEKIYKRKTDAAFQDWIRSMKEMKDIHYYGTELVRPINQAESYTRRKEIIREATGTIYISGSTLKDAFSTDSKNKDISILQTLFDNHKLETINIFLLNYVYLDIKCDDGNEDGSAEIERSIINFLGKVNTSSGNLPQINIVLLSNLHIPFILLTDQAMITRNTHLFTKSRSYKGQYLDYNNNNDEYTAVKAYFEYLLSHSYPVDLSSKKESEYGVKRVITNPKNQKIRKYVSLKKIHPAQLFNLSRATFMFQDEDTTQPAGGTAPAFTSRHAVDMQEFITPDPTQKVLLRYLEKTQRLFEEVVKLHDTHGYVEIIPSVDLGMPNNVTRIAGGFLTGALYDWRCAVPLIPIDATVNTCTSSVFSLADFDETLSDSQFDALIAELSKRANKNGYALNFLSGNHFLTVAKDDDGQYYLVMHSSAKECKESCFGLYPSKRVWYKPYIKTHISADQERYFRYIRGDMAMKFVDYADRFRDYNQEIHTFIAETFAELLSTSLTNDTRIIRHHYGMPTHNSIVIGTFPIDINSEDRTVPIFSDYGKDICIFEMDNEQTYIHRLIGTFNDITLVPHGWGQVVDELQDISISNVPDESARELILHCKHKQIRNNVDPEERLKDTDKHVRAYSNIESFVKMNKLLSGRILRILHPLYCYCKRSTYSDPPVYKLKERDEHQ